MTKREDCGQKNQRTDPSWVYTLDGLYRGKEIKPPIMNRKNADPQAV